MAVDVHLRSKCHEEEAKRIPNDHFRHREQRFVRDLYEVLKVHKKMRSPVWNQCHKLKGKSQGFPFFISLLRLRAGNP
jgi:hypothetical protein